MVVVASWLFSDSLFQKKSQGEGEGSHEPSRYLLVVVVVAQETAHLRAERSSPTLGTPMTCHWRGM